MIKNLIAASLLAVTPINKTIKPNQTTIKTQWEQKTEWDYTYTGYDSNDAVAFYRNQKGQYLNNGILTQKQKMLEFYLGVEENTGFSDIYILSKIIVNTEEITVYSNSITGQIGAYYNAHPTMTIENYYLKNQNINILESWLNSDNYTTYNQLQSVVTGLENLITLGTRQSSTANPQIENLTQIGQLYESGLNNNESIYLMQKIQIEWPTSILRPWEEPITTFDSITQQSNLLLKYNFDTENYGEIVDIPGLLLTIIGMPFAFISQAFDLTIFPGTPYAVNISHIFLALICVGIIIFIIKKVLK